MDHKRFNVLASKLTIEQIASFTDAEIVALRMERPGHPGVYGFMLGMEYFASKEHLATTHYALLKRLGLVKQK